MIKRFNLTVVFVTILLVLIACSNNNEGQSSSSSTNKGENTLEFFSWWTAGGEADALNALIDGFNEDFPDIKVENAAVSGGGGSNAKAVLANRMMADDPPSTFQVHGGVELKEWIDTEKLQSIDDIYEENDWYENFPEKIIEMESQSNSAYGVPSNISRMNVYFYNQEIFDKYDLAPPKTFEEFFDVAETLKANGVTPLALGDKDPWAANVLFDAVLFGNIEPDEYEQLWNGEISLSDDKIRESVEIYIKMLDYINDNHGSLDWQGATEMVYNGEAAMNVMGDWAVGYFTSMGWEPGVEFGWAPTPGSEGSFLVNNDSFVLPSGIENTEETKKFLTYMGSKEGQVEFNKIKGSIPARTDVDMSEFNSYSQETMEDFIASNEKGRIGLSMSRGISVPSGFLTNMENAINLSVTQKDVDSFIDSMEQAGNGLK